MRGGVDALAADDDAMQHQQQHTSLTTPIQKQQRSHGSGSGSESGGAYAVWPPDDGGDDGDTAAGAQPPAAALSSPPSASRRTSFVLGAHHAADAAALAARYELKAVIGRGSYAVTRLAVERATGLHYACKCIDKAGLSSDERRRVRREVQCMHLLAGHPGVVRLVEALEDARRVYLVMELCSGGELVERLARCCRGGAEGCGGGAGSSGGGGHNGGAFSERAAARAIRDALEAVAYAHDLGVVHRDIKLDNFLLADAGPDAALKLADWGYASFIHSGGGGGGGGGTESGGGGGGGAGHEAAAAAAAAAGGGAEAAAAAAAAPAEGAAAALGRVGSGAGGGVAAAPRRLHKLCGTCTYVAPEVIAGDYDERADVWSCGVMLYALLAGRLPFGGRSQREVLATVRSEARGVPDL